MRKLSPDGGEGELVSFDADACDSTTRTRTWEAAAASTGFVVRTTAKGLKQQCAGHLTSAKFRIRLGVGRAAAMRPPDRATVDAYASALKRDGSRVVTPLVDTFRVEAVLLDGDGQPLRAPDNADTSFFDAAPSAPRCVVHGMNLQFYRSVAHAKSAQQALDSWVTRHNLAFLRDKFDRDPTPEEDQAVYDRAFGSPAGLSAWYPALALAALDVAEVEGTVDRVGALQASLAAFQAAFGPLEWLAETTTTGGGGGLSLIHI